MKLEPKVGDELQNLQAGLDAALDERACDVTSELYGSLHHFQLKKKEVSDFDK